MTTTEKKVTRILEKHFGLFADKDLLKSRIYKDLHFNDLEFMEFITRVETELSIKIDDEKIFLMDRFGIKTNLTVQEVANCAQEKLTLKRKNRTKKLKDQLLKFWWCNIWSWHNWTSVAEEKETNPSALMVSELPEDANHEQHKQFMIDNSKIWCKRCNIESPLSIKWRAKLKAEL